MQMPWEISAPASPAPRGKIRPLMNGKVHRLSRRGAPCPYCQRTMNLSNGRHASHAPSRDHKVPISRGGTNDSENVEICCRRCNEQKGQLTPEEFRAVRAGLASRLDQTTPERRDWRAREVRIANVLRMAREIANG